MSEAIDCDAMRSASVEGLSSVSERTDMPTGIDAETVACINPSPSSEKRVREDVPEPDDVKKLKQMGAEGGALALAARPLPGDLFALLSRCLPLAPESVQALPETFRGARGFDRLLRCEEDQLTKKGVKDLIGEGEWEDLRAMRSYAAASSDQASASTTRAVEFLLAQGFINHGWGNPLARDGDDGVKLKILGVPGYVVGSLRLAGNIEHLSSAERDAELSKLLTRLKFLYPQLDDAMSLGSIPASELLSQRNGDEESRLSQVGSSRAL